MPDRDCQNIIQKWLGTGIRTPRDGEIKPLPYRLAMPQQRLDRQMTGKEP